jgi:outer membrane protein TolC
VELVPPDPVRITLMPVDQYVVAALRDNPEVMAAAATLRKAQAGVSAARAEYIPEVGLALMHVYQSSMPFFRNHSFAAGLQLNWAIFDFGKRGSMLEERRSQVAQAEANVRMVEGRVRGEVEKAHRQVRQAEAMVELAREAAALRQEAARLQGGQQQAGFLLTADAQGSMADALQGVADLVAAELGYRLALVELQKATGVRP